MTVLVWHVHGSWMTSFVHGTHDYLVPALPDRGPDGRGRAETYPWPPNAHEITPDELAHAPIDAVVIQRAHELELCERWLGGRRPGHDLPMAWVEHNAPQGRVNEMRHPSADFDGDCRVVHVTHTNALLWDTGTTPWTVIEHGVPDPGARYTGTLPHTAVVVNEPVRRGRVAGTDLLGHFAALAPLDVFGIATRDLERSVPGVRAHGDVPHGPLLEAVARRRVYLHPYRWTSLGLALIEAMFLAMPVVVVATLEAATRIPPEAGVVATALDELADGLDRLLRDPVEAARRGRLAREIALARFPLSRFLADWDRILEEMTK
jgi:hypothetical protein